MTARGAAEDEPARLRARATSSAPPASSARGRATCAASAAGRSASSMRAVATAPGPRPSGCSTHRRARSRSPGAISASPSTSISCRPSSARCARTRRASAVVVDVRTGRLLALYCKPDFDPNDLSGGAGRDRIRESVQQALHRPAAPDARQDDERRLPARAPRSSRSARSPRSRTSSSTPNEHERCDGYLSFGRRIFHCTHVHGKVDMRDAIAESCNVYFFKLAESVGMDRIARIATEFGLGAEDRHRREPGGRRAASPRARGTRSATRASSASASRSTRRSARARRR